MEGCFRRKPEAVVGAGAAAEIACRITAIDCVERGLAWQSP